MANNVTEGLSFNVAGLLRENVGATREYAIGEGSISLYDDASACDLKGTAKLLRITTGVLVDGRVSATLELQCSRCLSDFSTRVSAEFEEEYRPRIDVTSGAPVEVTREGETEEDFFSIGLDHVLDLEEAVRQALVLHIPFNPVCREDCAGLCQECGANLNNSECECAPVRRPTALEGLEVLLRDMHDTGRDV